MKLTKARKQDNALVVTIAKSFHITEGTKFCPKLTDNGILYAFVNLDHDNFFDFDEDILTDSVSQGYEGQKLINRFKQMKAMLPAALDQLIEESEKEAAKAGPMSQAEFNQEIDCSDEFFRQVQLKKH